MYLVGAGPGHPGLITRMGYRLLRSCDAVAYDALIPLELIAELPQRVERHYVGKRAGRHSMAQKEKSQVLVDLALRGLNVVRLKGGDTSFFAGSAEEVECLTTAGIRVVVVPGVTAASAVAAASGLSITDRRAASWAFLATGHGSSCEPIPVPWREIAALSGGTVVVYMGLANLEQIVEQLRKGGIGMDTPCMVVQGASTGLQRTVETTIRELVGECRRQGLKPPVLVMIGEVVRHRTPVAGHDEEPLAGKRILVTSCALETQKICKLLREHGAEPIAHPTFALEEVDDAEGWAEFDRVAGPGGWCVFAGELEVGAFVDGMLRHELDLRRLARFKIAAIGSRTAAALLERGLKADLVSQLPVEQMLRQELRNGSGSNFGGLVTMLAGSMEVALEADTSAGWTDIVRLRLFRTIPAPWEPHWVQELVENPPDCTVFTSPMAVDGFVEMLGRDMARRVAARGETVSIDRPTTAAAERYGLAVAATAGSATVEGVVSALIQHRAACQASIFTAEAPRTAEGRRE